MAAGRLLIPGWNRAVNGNGNPIAAAVSLFNLGTDSLATVYADEALTVPLANPVQSNSAGRFPAIWADDANTFDWSVTAPYGPPGSPFTGTGLTTALTADILIAEAAEAAASAAQTYYEDILAIEAAGSDPLAIATRAAKAANGSDFADKEAVTQNLLVRQSGTGTTQRTLRDKTRDIIDVRDFGVSTGDVDNTAAIQAALDEAEGSDRSVVVVNEFYQVPGTISVPGGITFASQSGASEYYLNNPFSDASSAGLYKPSDGENGPLLIAHTGSAITGLYLRHEKVGGANTGVIQMAEDSPTSMIFNALVQGCRINGHAINENTNVWQDSDCHGIWFPHGTLNEGLRYFNKINGNWLANFDIGIRLGDQANGNVLVGNHTRQVYRHYVFDGGDTECVGNVVEAALMANQGFLPTNTPYCVTLIGSVSFLKFGGISEQNGKAFDIAGYTGGTDLDFGGFNPNEVAPSYPPIGSIVRGFAPVKAADGGRQLLLPNSTAETRYEQGQGNKIERFELVTGTLPQLGGAGALVAADPDSRRIVTFNDTVYSKAARTSFSARLKVFVCSTGGGTGEHLVEVDFVYRVTDQASSAGELSVKSVRKSPASGNYVAGLYFLDGVAAGGNFAIAMTGGNLGPFNATHVAVDLEITALSHTTNSLAMADLADLSFVSAACTANDVTDANDLLTVADIVI